MKLSIDLGKENLEDLRIVAELIKRRIPREADREDIRNFNINERVVMAVIDGLTTKVGSLVPICDIVEESKKLDLNEEGVSDAVDELKKKGEIFEAKEGFIQKI